MITNITKHDENLTKSKVSVRAKFEQIPEVAERINRSKLQFESGRYYSPEWVSQASSDEDFVNNFYKGWQSRQAEINHLEGNLIIEKLSKTSHKLASEEKDRRIERALQFIDQFHCEGWLYDIDNAEKALRGTHE